MLAVESLSFTRQKGAVTSGEPWQQPHHCLEVKVKNCLVSNRDGKGGQDELITTVHQDYHMKCSRLAVESQEGMVSASRFSACNTHLTSALGTS